MEKLSNILMLLLLLAFSACEISTPSDSGSTTDPVVSDSTSGNNEQPEEPAVTEPLQKPECQIAGTVLEENLFWARNENLLIAIVADEETNDPEMGESHRILEVYDGNSCERLIRNVMPVNVSPDFPYYLSDITYNNLNRVVAIRGFDKIYIFDLSSKELSGPLDPAFINERFAEDAQSGMIQRLELWENYLVGYATSEGVFVFDLKEPMSAKAVLPSAEFEIARGIDYNSLFFLESEGKGHQAILPHFDQNTGDFDVNPLFDEPVKIEPNINRNFRNNQYLVLKELLGGTESRPIGINMKAKKKYDIPADVAAKKATDIIAWMKTQ